MTVTAVDTFEYTDAVSTPESGTLTGIFYDANSETLVVVFKDSGRKYSYKEFDADEWEDFKDANSKGRFYNYYVSGSYTSEQLPDEVRFVRVPEGFTKDPQTPNVVSGPLQTSTLGVPSGENISAKAADALKRKYTVNAVLWVNNVESAGVSFDADAGNDEEAVNEFLNYVSRLNAAGEWSVRSVTRHF